LLIYDEGEKLVKRTARNLPGVDTCCVSRLNVLQLAPGGHLGRLCVFTEKGFKAVSNVFGSYKADSIAKKGYNLNRHVMACADLARIINSDQVQSKLREVRESIRVHDKTKKNPLTNKAMMLKVNPFAKQKASILKALEEKRRAGRKALLKAKQGKVERQKKAKRTKLDQERNAGLFKSF